MKKHLMILAVALVALSIAMPALAEVEFKYGGSFRARWLVQDNVFDGTDIQFSPNYNSDDNRHFVDQRLRLNFSFIASKNLKLVTAFEMGDAIWGQGSNGAGAAQGNTGANMGANLGGDSVSVEVKNVFLQFNIPNTPTTGIIGLQPLVLLDSWIIGDDVPAAVFVTDLDPFKVTLGYAGGQNGWERPTSSNFIATTNDTFNVDDFFLSLDYKSGPFKASLIGFLQFGHDSSMSIDPSTYATPIRTAVGQTTAFLNDQTITVGSTTTKISDYQYRNNALIDLGLNLTYKVDYLLAYVNFVKNLGGTDLPNNLNSVVAASTLLTPAEKATYAGVYPNRSADYTGFMIDAGVTYFCGPWTANIGGFYTTGPDIANNVFDFQRMYYLPAVGATQATASPIYTGNQIKPFKNLQGKDVEWFTYPAGVQKATSELIGGGILGEDLYVLRGYSSTVAASGIGQPAGQTTPLWKGWYQPENVWTITAGGSYQATPTTKVSASYWYWGVSENVPVAVNLDTASVNFGKFDMSSSIGHELDLYVDQKIVDGLTLTLVGAYLFADDAFAPYPINLVGTQDYISTVDGTLHKTATLPDFTANPGLRNAFVFNQAGQAIATKKLAQDAFEVGARLQWNF